MQYPEGAKGVSLSPNDKGGGNGGVAYVGTNDYGITFAILGSANNKSAENWYLQYYQDEKQEATELDAPCFLAESGQVVQLNSYTAYETGDFNFDSTRVNFYIVHNDIIYKLVYIEQIVQNVPKWDEYKKIIEQMLSTFKFLQ